MDKSSTAWVQVIRSVALSTETRELVGTIENYRRHSRQGSGRTQQPQQDDVGSLRHVVTSLIASLKSYQGQLDDFFDNRIILVTKNGMIVACLIVPRLVMTSI